MTKKIAAFVLALIPLVSQAQKTEQDDLPAQIEITNQPGKVDKVMVVYPAQVLIIDGDSIYTVLNELQLRRILERKPGFDVINEPDSIQKILSERIKSIIVVKPEEPEK